MTSSLHPSISPVTRIKRFLPLRPQLSHPDRRGTLRDLYTSGLVSIFRRDSVLRIWEPLRETPRRTTASDRTSHD